ncbi:hypothetical protein EVAR_33817_1 [Eumeta japonica]|uniref:Uncharacterized protein n=1 Tax=Eumeta variegata TaxID=151549 RepID=A0A4C1VDC0_EUMVA|nr:hypothetical protein EVAR_33817_1 [Eumeta japonica]
MRVSSSFQLSAIQRGGLQVRSPQSIIQTVRELGSLVGRSTLDVNKYCMWCDSEGLRMKRFDIALSSIYVYLPDGSAGLTPRAALDARKREKLKALNEFPLRHFQFRAQALRTPPAPRSIRVSPFNYMATVQSVFRIVI